MAIFREDANPWNQLDWQLLQHGAVSLYSRRTILDEDLAWLAEHSYAIDRLDCSAWTSEPEVYRALTAAFAFPTESLDAFSDCVGALAITDPGRVIVLGHFTTVGLGVLDVIAIQARQHLLFGRRLLALVQTDDPKLVLPPIGATRVTWNPREWLAAARAN